MSEHVNYGVRNIGLCDLTKASGQIFFNGDCNLRQTWEQALRDLVRDYPNVYTPNPDTYVTINNGSSFQGCELTYLEYKNSINSPNWFSREVVDLVDLRLVKPELLMRRPKIPIYDFTRKFIPKAPILRVLKESDMGDIAVVSPESRRYFAYLKAIEDRKAFVALTNQRRRLVYLRKLAAIESKTASNLQKQKEYDRIFQIRKQRYLVQLAKWKAAQKRAINGELRKRKAKHMLDPPDHPYLYGYFDFRDENPSMTCGQKSVLLSPVNSEIPGIDTCDIGSIYYEERFLAVNKVTRPYVTSMGKQLCNNLVEQLETRIHDLDAKNIRKIYSKVAKREVHIGNLIAERHQTLEMLASLYKRVGSLVTLKKGLFSSVVRYLKSPKSLANDILAWKFGMEPLISEMASLIQYLEKDKSDPKIVVRCNSHEFVSFENSEMTFDGRMEISYVVRFKVFNSGSRLVNRFGLMNPLEILWEVTPWSFVVDWFIPIGSWIASEASVSGCTFDSGTRKVYYKGVFRVKSPTLGRNPADNLLTENLWIECPFSGVLKSRTVLTTAPESLEMLRFKDPWSISHLVETVALVTQRIKSLK
jgi:hypothetical protein